MKTPVTIAVVMTVFNRRETTLACLDSLVVQAGVDQDFLLHAWILDDGSTDGTADAVSHRFPEFVTVLRGRGGDFWSRGMANAQNIAESSAPDYIMWLNDDVILRPDALTRLLETHDGYNSIVVGAVESATTGRTTYSGFKKVGSRPGQVEQVEPAAERQRVDTINGNIVLIPRSVYAMLHGPDPVFAHAYGDWDYGYRARALGFDVWLAPGYFGSCERNSVRGSWRDSSASRWNRLARLFDRKGYPLRSHLAFTYRHGGKLWLIYFVATYVRAIFAIVRGR